MAHTLHIAVFRALAASLAFAHAAPVVAQEMTARQLTEQLYKAEAGATPDYSGKNLEGLDLSGIDFKKARLGGANLFGADLSEAKLADSDLHGARLDRANLIRANLDRADLSGSSILRPTTTTSIGIADVTETPSFRGANLEGARIFGQFAGGYFQAAKLKGASLAPFGGTGFIEHLWHTNFTGADLSGADLSGANLAFVTFRFANLRGASLKGARLTNADLARADLTGADLTGADLTGADLSNVSLEGAILDGAKGLETVAGSANAPRPVQKAIE